MSEPDKKKKRGRKKKSETISENIQIEIKANSDANNNDVNENTQPVLKKRGRKPKGGKIISKDKEIIKDNNVIPNVILHLKCSLNEINSDLNIKDENSFIYNPTVPPEIETYNINEKKNFFNYEDNNDINYAYSNKTSNKNICEICNKINTDNVDYDDTSMKDINYKLKTLKINLYKNSLKDKKSACFWCTYDYDNPSCYIPKYDIDEQVYGYGSFCRPECAVAFLMKENIDDSSKFERYNLLNNIYGKIYNFKKNIKPAPDPHFILDKFYGNLSIKEYRKLLNSEHLLLVVEKPMTRILPELYEDNDNFVMNIYSNNDNNNSNSMYKVKRNSDKKDIPNKKTIIQDTFGLSK